MKHSLVTYLPVLVFLGLMSIASLVSFPFTVWSYLTANPRTVHSVALSGHFLNWAPIIIGASGNCVGKLVEIRHAKRHARHRTIPTNT